MINRNRRPLKPKHQLFFPVIPAVVGRYPEIILITPPSLPGKKGTKLILDLVHNLVYHITGGVK